jgi:PAS domain-containing protein
MDKPSQMTVPTLTINADGTMADANAAALDLLRVTLQQLRELPPGAFSAEPADPAADEAFREQWENEGNPDIGARERCGVPMARPSA